MKKLLCLMVAIAMLLPGFALGEENFIYMYLDCKPILPCEGKNIPFVILTSGREWQAQMAGYGDQIAKYSSVYGWNEQEQRFGQLLEPIVDGVNGYNYNGVTVNSYDPVTMSGTLSFRDYGWQYLSPNVKVEQYMVTARQYYDGVPLMVDRAVADCQSYSQKQTARALHDWLCERITYDEGRGRGTFMDVYQGSGYGGMQLGKGKCSSYAAAYTILLRTAGIEAFTLDGTGYTSSSSGPHAWNIARLDGEWVFIDVTWDDRDPGIRYDYFAISKAQMDRNHTLDAEDEAFVRYLMDGRFDQALRNAGW